MRSIKREREKKKEREKEMVKGLWVMWKGM